MEIKTGMEWKGYLWAFVGTISFSSLYVFSKSGLNQVELAQFGLYYFGLGFLLNLVFAFASGKLKVIRTIPKSVVKLLIVIGIIDLASNLAFFLSIRAIPDPSVTSFLGNLFPIFLSILGYVFLKERFTLLEGLGAFIAVLGAFVISYTGDTQLSKFFIAGTGIVVINTLLAATVSVIIKKNVDKASPEIFNLNSNMWLFVFFIFYFLYSGHSIIIPINAFSNIALGAFFGSFLGLLSFYYSYKYIAATKSSIIQSIKGVFVLTIAYFYLGTFPLPIQIIGGIITIFGVVLMTFARAGVFKSLFRKTEI